MTPEEREEYIRAIYYQELGTVEPDQDGLDYWMGREDLADEAALRRHMRGAAELDPASSLQPLLADEQFAAWLRGAQFNESAIQSSLEATQNALARRIQEQRATFDTQLRDQSRNIDRSYEARGNRSGGLHVDQNNARTSIDRSRLQFESGIADQKASAERQAAQQIGAIRREGAEEQVAARNRLTMQSAGMG